MRFVVPCAGRGSQCTCHHQSACRWDASDSSMMVSWTHGLFAQRITGAILEIHRTDGCPIETRAHTTYMYSGSNIRVYNSTGASLRLVQFGFSAPYNVRQPRPSRHTHPTQTLLITKSRMPQFHSWTRLLVVRISCR